MSEFKRSPSKVWWGNDNLEWREVSSSPGSQDSGFSDSETSPHVQPNSNRNRPETPKKTPVQRIPKDIFKELTSMQAKQNISTNYKEKLTPEKTKLNGERLIKSDIKATTPKRVTENQPCNTEPVRKHRYTKNSPKVIRSLFSSKQKECKNILETHQYAKEVHSTLNTYPNSSVDATFADSYSYNSDNSKTTDEETESLTTKSLPVINEQENSFVLSKTAPAVLENCREYEEVTHFNTSLASDCESELECLFENGLDSPKHTSTPKVGLVGRMHGRREILPLRLALTDDNDRVPKVNFAEYQEIDNKSVKKWIEDIKEQYDQECMTTLQCKSIMADLNQKVSNLAALLTTTIRQIISHARCIEGEYENLNGESKHIDPLIQSLTGNIIDFLKTHIREINSKILKLCDEIRFSKSEKSFNLLATLFSHWNDIRHDLVAKEIKTLVNELEFPTSEIDLRAALTGITSISLRNEELIESFIKADIIPILLILCEKCEGSSMRCLILRALSTMCCSTLAIRQFEKYSGVQIVSDTLEEVSRPEPERSEACALLAQVTAPWLEDNHSVRGLQNYCAKLVKSLTKLAGSTKCCQNLLLSAAALANLSVMDTKAVKHMLHVNTPKVLLEAVESRGPRASIYLLEQVAALLANISASEPARKQLTKVGAPSALLMCLKCCSGTGEDVEKRLQQKSIIALSRLCGDQEAAVQVVENGGVEKLVRLCREKRERYDSDAVLVAALATLRKIVEACGSDILSAQDAQELVEPKLLDSFLAYSTQNESYV